MYLSEESGALVGMRDAHCHRHRQAGTALRHAVSWPVSVHRRGVALRVHRSQCDVVIIDRVASRVAGSGAKHRPAGRFGKGGALKVQILREPSPGAGQRICFVMAGQCGWARFDAGGPLGDRVTPSALTNRPIASGCARPEHVMVETVALGPEFGSQPIGQLMTTDNRPDSRAGADDTGREP